MSQGLVGVSRANWCLNDVKLPEESLIADKQTRLLTKPHSEYIKVTAQDGATH